MKEMTILHRMGEGGKCLIGMVHCLPLPGTLGHGGDMEKIYEKALTDARTLEAAGFDAVIVENTTDMPYARNLSAGQLAALAAITRCVVQAVRIPVGVDALVQRHARRACRSLCCGRPVCAFARLCRHRTGHGARQYRSLCAGGAAHAPSAGSGRHRRVCRCTSKTQPHGKPFRIAGGIGTGRGRLRCGCSYCHGAVHRAGNPNGNCIPRKGGVKAACYHR